MICFSKEDILKIIRSFDLNKSHGHDNISIRMIKLCDKEICKPLHMIFVSCMEEGIFSLLWKMANVVPAHKKNDKRSIKNYRPVSLLPIFGKTFERLLHKLKANGINGPLLNVPEDFQAKSCFKWSTFILE